MKSFKMKLTYIVILLFAFTLFANAQKKLTVGILGGLNSSKFYNYNVNLRKANLISYSFGADLGYLLKDHLSFRANLMYERKGEETNFQLVDFTGNELPPSSNFILNYLTLNLLTRGSFGNKFRFIAEGGPYIGYLLSAKAVGKNTIGTINGNSSNPIILDIRSEYKSANFGIVAGMGLEYQLNTKVSISLTLRNSLGLTSVTKENTLNSNLKTNSIQCLAGVSFNL
jgi:hypothetical protein